MQANQLKQAEQIKQAKQSRQAKKSKQEKSDVSKTGNPNKQINNIPTNQPSKAAIKLTKQASKQDN